MAGISLKVHVDEVVIVIDSDYDCNDANLQDDNFMLVVVVNGMYTY